MAKSNQKAVQEITAIIEAYLPGSLINEYVIVRTLSAGVFAGYLQSRQGQEVILTRARRLWYWSGAASLSQLSVDGVQDPGNCKFPCEVPLITLLQAIEILPVSAKAQKSIAGVSVWQK